MYPARSGSEQHKSWPGASGRNVRRPTATDSVRASGARRVATANTQAPSKSRAQACLRFSGSRSGESGAVDGEARE